MGWVRPVVVSAVVLAAMTPAIAGAAGAQPSAQYIDGTIMTWRPRSGATAWTAKPSSDRYLQARAVGPSVVVADSGRCRDDGLVRSRPVALDARTGKTRWSSSVGRAIVASDTGSGIVVTTTPDQSKVVGLSAKTGKHRWTIRSSTVVGANPTAVFVRAKAGSSAPFDARDRATGRSRWTYTMPPETGPGYVSTVVASNAQLTVIASGSSVGITSVTGVFKPIGSTILLTLDSATGRELHRTVVDDPELTFAHGVLRDGVLALVNGREIIGIELAAGTLAWRHPIPEPSANYRGVLAPGRNGQVSLFTDAQRQSTIALDTVTGATLWSRPALTMLGSAGAAPVVFLVPRGTGKKAPVEGVDVATGRTLWTRTVRSTYAVPEPVLGQPRLAPMSVQCGTP